MESLTMDDIDTYAMISQRLTKEDVFSIVDSFFMPSGLECDQYSVMGEITEMNTTKNAVTGEQVYELGLVCNDVPIDICINEKDLFGVPEVGRRFKIQSSLFFADFYNDKRMFTGSAPDSDAYAPARSAFQEQRCSVRPPG